jgi:nitroimidazol reductase NimA-like FMN-containing flavoprotein (pyridoxamine 5'-phosphate oxidase superfamily)
MDDQPEPTPEDIARRVINDNCFMVLGTVQADGSPRVSPVYYDHIGYGRYYWVSSPHAQHSMNIAAHPRVEFVIFNSRATPGTTSAVYLGGLAGEVPSDELALACAEAFARVREGARAFTPDELCGAAELRLYRVDVDQAEIHVRGSDPVRGKGVDTRLEVNLWRPRPDMAGWPKQRDA